MAGTYIFVRPYENHKKSRVKTTRDQAEDGDGDMVAG